MEPSRPLTPQEDRAGGGHALPEASAREQASQREGCLGLIMVFHMIGSVVGTAFAWSMTANLRGFDDELPPPEADYVLLGVAIVTVLLAIRTMIRAPLLGRLPTGSSYFTVFGPAWSVLALLGANGGEAPQSVSGEAQFLIPQAWAFVLGLCSAPLALAVAFELAERRIAAKLRSVLFGWASFVILAVWLRFLPLQVHAVPGIVFGVGLVALVPSTALVWLLWIYRKDWGRPTQERCFARGITAIGVLVAGLSLASYLALV